jgi:hypothetical protein
MSKMSDGTYLQSNLSMKPPASAYKQMRLNVTLKTGTVTKMYYPDDPKNLSGTFIEYDVAVSEQISDGGTTVSTYRNCKMHNPFGASNNSATYTLQPNAQIDDDPTKGAQCLLLCIDGRSDGGQGVIISGLSDEGSPDYTSADGQFYDFNFNGINYNINKDGEWTVTFNSPIDEDGKKANSDAAGTKIKIDKEGRVTISDNEMQSWTIDRVAKTSTWGNGSESVVIDKGNKSISMMSGGEMSQTSQKAMSMSSQDATNITSQKDMTLNSSNNLNVQSSQNMAQKSGAGWTVQATGDVMVQAGGNAMIQASGVAQVQGLTTLLGAGDLPAAAVGISQVLSYLGPIPIMGQILTGSATVFVGT